MNSTVQQLVESSVRFPLAMFAFGVQQGARVLAGRHASMRNAGASFCVVSQSARREFGDLLSGGFQIGDAILRDLVDAVFEILLQPHRGTRTAADGSPSLFRLPQQNVRLAIQELRNKMHVYEVVKHAKRVQGLETGAVPLSASINAAYSRPDFDKIWVVEGLGHDYVAAVFEPGRVIRGILTDPQREALPAKVLTMMHAGMGLAFAESLWNGISPYDSEARMAAAIDYFVQLCSGNSTPGYAGAARESLGLATLTLEPLLVPEADRAICAIAPETAGYFWHGVGRALYFFPTYFVPGLVSPWTGILDRAPHRLGKCNLIAGLAWATALVNMRHPEIVAELVASLDPAILRTGAFANGVAAAMTMAYDIEPANPWIEGFVNYAAPQNIASCWDAVVRGPCNYALAQTYPGLKSQGRLEELFQYAPDGGSDACV